MSRRRAAIVVCLLCSACCLLSGCGGGAVTTTELAPKSNGPARAEDSREAARQLLAEAPTRTACVDARNQLNSYLAAHQDQRPPTLTSQQKRLLQVRFGLDDGELAEVESPTFTLLDASHLEFCFLLRDVVRSLDVDKLSQAEQAATAFAWTVRQVVPAEKDAGLPPDFVLRRGWGGPLERAEVFVALLQQMGIPGCLIIMPDAEAPWACGALVTVEGSNDRQVLVFDHRVGLPLPGPKGAADSPLARAFRLALPVPVGDDGRQIATLAAIRKQPELLKELTVDDKQPYDIGAAQVKDSVVRLATPLSALSPRMRALRDPQLLASLGDRLGIDPAELIHQFGTAAGVEGGDDAVRAQEKTASTLRRFLGESEGGIDRAGLLARARMAMVPQNAWPRQIAALEGDPAERIRQYAAHQFLVFQFDARQPRDLVLRGQFKDAAGQLTELLSQLRIQKDRLDNNKDMYEKFEAWKKELYEAYRRAGEAMAAMRKGGSQEAAERAMQDRERMWKAGLEPLGILVEGGMADSRLVQVLFQQAVCMHEEAERLQSRAEQLSRRKPVNEEELKAARVAAARAWLDAAGWWNRHTSRFPTTPLGIHGRQMQARALMMLANLEPYVIALVFEKPRPEDPANYRRQARARLEEAPPSITPHQKIARLYLARRLTTP